LGKRRSYKIANALGRGGVYLLCLAAVGEIRFFVSVDENERGSV
jgi:hypothetical protein